MAMVENLRVKVNGDAHGLDLVSIAPARAVAPFVENAPRAIEAGYSVVPTRHKPREGLPARDAKRPAIKGWQEFCGRQMTPAELARHSKGLPLANIAVAVGYAAAGRGNICTLAVDIDTNDEAFIRAVRSVIPESNVARFGSKGRADIYQIVAPEGVTVWDHLKAAGVKLRHYPPGEDGKKGRAPLLELPMNVLVPPSIHPETGRPYEWLGACTIYDTLPEELTEITIEQLGPALEAAISPWLYKEPAREPSPTRPAAAGNLRDDERAAYQRMADKAADKHIPAVRAMRGKGGRGGALYSAACALGMWVKHGFLDQHRVESELFDASMENGLVAENGKDDVRRTIANGFDKAAADQLPALKERARPRAPRAAGDIKTPDGVKTSRGRPLPTAPTIDGSDGRPTINIYPGEIHTVTDEAMSILVASGIDIFQRGKGLVRPIRVKGMDSKGGIVHSACLIEVEKEWIRKKLCASINWYKQDSRVKHGWRKIDAPEDIAMSILKSKGEWAFRTISGVISTPTLRYDGSILRDQGFDKKTHLYLDSAVELPHMPDNPTRADAELALALLNGLLEEFPFVNKASKSVSLSAMLSAVARGMVDVVPGHGSNAPAAGTGKSYLFDIVSAIIMGERCPVISASEDSPGETEKRIIGSAISGQQIINVDNVNGTLGGDALCQIIERPVCNLRALGKSDLVRVENRAIVFFTGNNVRVKGDMTRRVVIAELDACMEKPAEREFKNDPVAAVLAKRGAYIAACMTIIRAYLHAGSPKQSFKPMNSFGEWSGTVRSALVWLGEDDPCLTVQKARDEDPESQKLAAFISAAKPFICGEFNALPAREIVKLGTAEEHFGSSWEPKHPDLNSSIAEFRDRAGISPTRFGYWLRGVKGKVADGCRISSVKDTDKKVEKWFIEDIRS